MILRRIIDHVKTQNWTAVGIDFVIVVVGVFIGIQVSNWNDARADERAYQDAMKRLVEDPRLLERQSDEERIALRKYHSSLHDQNFTAEFLVRMADAGNDSHPFIGFTALVDPDQTINGVDVRRARVDASLQDACKDKSFLKLFYRWERVHVFQLHLIDQLEEIVRENMRALNLRTAAATEGDS